MSEVRESLEKRARRAIFERAFFRWESAVMIALTLGLAVFGPDLIPIIPWWGWLAGGSLGEAALVWSSMNDANVGRQAVADMLRRDFKPERLRSPQLQRQINEAFDYRSRVTGLIQEKEDSVLRDKLIGAADQFDTWIEEMYDLAKRLDRYLIERDKFKANRDKTARRVETLQRKLQIETNPAVIDELDKSIASLTRQINTFEQLDDSMERAQLRLDSTLSAMGTIYSQMLLLGAKDVDSARYRRLEHEISEEVHELADVLHAMDEIYVDEVALE